MRVRLFFVAIAIVVASVWAASDLQILASSEPQLAPRKRAAKGDHPPLPPNTPVQSIVIKFHEGTKVRLRNRMVVEGRNARESRQLAALGLAAQTVGADLQLLQTVLKSNSRLGPIERLFTLTEESLAAARAAGEASSGQELADLDLYYRAPVPPGTTQADVEALIALMNDLASVEIAYAEAPAPPPAADIPPTTPNLVPNQDYLNAAPTGIDARYAWTQTGGRGQGVKIVDVEYGWQVDHEDLPALFVQGGTNSTNPGYRDHGTAVLGVLVAVKNGYGMTGIVSDAQMGYQSQLNPSVASAINKGATNVGAGGIVLLEVQSWGPLPASNCGCGPCNLAPAEWEQANYDAIAQATANGVIVVEAAANGGTNLDDPVYLGKFNRAQRDSKAILVGAGTSTSHAPTCFTNYGSRVDVQGWGENVATFGGGSLFNGGGDVRQFYTAGFNGTSSASPIVAGAAASLQGISLARGKGRILPLAMRSILRQTGTAQASDSRQVGPLPNLRAAIAALPTAAPTPTPGGTPTPTPTPPCSAQCGIQANACHSTCSTNQQCHAQCETNYQACLAGC